MTTVRRPVAWSRANFYLSTVHSHDVDNRTILTVVPLAQLNPLTGQFGGSIGEASRGIQVGGIKFTVWRQLLGFNNDPTATISSEDWRDTNLRNVDTKFLLVSDRLVVDSGTGAVSPQALNTNWFTNTFPIATTPEVQDEDIQFPTRIHWQDYKRFDQSLGGRVDDTISGGEDPSQITWTQNAIANTPSHTTANLKLRLRVQDDECLALHFASHCQSVSTATDLEPEVAFVATGTLWYRVKF